MGRLIPDFDILGPNAYGSQPAQGSPGGFDIIANRPQVGPNGQPLPNGAPGQPQAQQPQGAPMSGLMAGVLGLRSTAARSRAHAAALAYGTLRRRYDRSGGPMRSWRDRSGLSDEAWQAVKRDHACMIRAAGAERFVLDRLCLDDDAPLSSKVERVRVALDRVAG